MGIGKNYVILFVHINEMGRRAQNQIEQRIRRMKNELIIGEEDSFLGLLNEQGEGISMKEILASLERGESCIEIDSIIYKILLECIFFMINSNIIEIYTKYKLWIEKLDLQ